VEPIIEQITCPKNPDHGMVNKRWLHPDDRQMITKGVDDVFEIDCAHCGKYEHRDEQTDEK
jgi:hypothetical protein